MNFISFVVLLLALASCYSHVEALSANLVAAANDPGYRNNPYGFLAGRGPTWFGGWLGPSTTYYNMNVDRYFAYDNSWLSLPQSPAPTKWGQGACAHPDGSKMVVYGGTLFNSQTPTASVSIVDSVSLGVTVLAPGQGPAMHLPVCVVTPSSRVYYFGGFENAATQERSQKTWTTNLVTGVTTMITPVGISPPARSGHGAVWNGTAMIIFGGDTFPGGATNDMWGYNPTTNAWIPIPTPSRVPPNFQYLHAVWQGAWYIFGGYFNFNTQYTSVYKFNLATNSFSQVQVTLPTTVNRGTAISVGNGIFYLRSYNVSLMKVDLNP